MRLPDGRELRFADVAVPSALAYEGSVAHDAVVPTRAGNLHDACNALAWLAFPRAKAALNAVHVGAAGCDVPPSPAVSPTLPIPACGEREQPPPGGVDDRSMRGVAAGGGSSSTRGRSSLRGLARDAATLLDESGLLLACADDSLVALLRAHRWREVFVDRADDVARAMRPFVIGHGLLAKLWQPFRAITAHVLVVPLAAADARTDAVDAAAAHLIAEREWPRGRLAVLPIAALPGWDGEGLGAALFDDTTVFRPPRAAR
ncbi:MAG: DUF3025 domain-containing protein [Burkholderiales bacterium]